MARLFDGDVNNRLTLDAPTRAMGTTPPPDNFQLIYMLQAWVYPTTTINTDRTICAKGDDSGVEIELYVNSSGNAGFRIDTYCVAKFWQVEGATTITPDQWWCITAVKANVTSTPGDQITWIYVNGVDDSSVVTGDGYPDGGGMCDQSSEVNIGCRPDGAAGYERPWEGRIAEVAHVTGAFLQATVGVPGLQALLAGPVSLLKDAGFYGFPASAIRAYWQLFGYDDPETYFSRQNWVWQDSPSDIPVIGTVPDAPHAPVMRRHKLRGQ